MNLELNYNLDIKLKLSFENVIEIYNHIGNLQLYEKNF